MSDVEQQRRLLSKQQLLRKKTNRRQQLILNLLNRNNTDWNGLISAPPISVSRYQRRCAAACRTKGENSWTMLNNPVPESVNYGNVASEEDPVMWNDGKTIIGEIADSDWSWSQSSNRRKGRMPETSDINYQYNINGKLSGS